MWSGVVQGTLYLPLYGAAAYGALLSRFSVSSGSAGIHMLPRRSRRSVPMEYSREPIMPTSCASCSRMLRSSHAVHVLPREPVMATVCSRRDGCL